MKLIFTWIWCFPQMLIGWIVKMVTKARKNGDHYEWNIQRGSASLGTYVFLCPVHYNSETTLKHEFGHTKQSYILGWLYMPLIFLPSLIWAGCFEKYRRKTGKSYYSFYTERWADKLAGIER